MIHYEYIMIYLKYFLKGHHLNFYGPFDPNINPHLGHDMTYPPAKFDVELLKGKWSRELKEQQQFRAKVNSWNTWNFRQKF